MIKKPTVFVVGAGGSNEFGLPVGRDLRIQISDMLKIVSYDGWNHGLNDRDINHTLMRSGVDQNKYIEAAQHIANAMPMAMSIDNFLDAHQGNEEIERCGKLAIVRCILEAERRSLLYHDHNSTINFSNLDQTWLNKFMQLATENCRLDQVNNIFANTSFICFNYDRCIEHYLYNALQTYYGLSANDSALALSHLKIVHPYGVVGNLPWQRKGSSTAYGTPDHGMDLFKISDQIKTFSEQIEDKEQLEELKNLSANADTMIFIGFAFHRQNMMLIAPPQKTSIKRIYATTMGISTSDQRVVSEQISKTANAQLPRALKIELLDSRCYELFDMHWRSLSQ